MWRWRWNKFKYYLNPDPEYEKYIAEERAKTRAFLAGHLETCYVAQYPDWQKCPSKEKMHGERVGEHWWSGWPGAWCIYCRNDDQFEVCLMRHCSCRCHHKFWKNYWNIAMRDIGTELEVFGL